jgi:hypothetical protein
VRCEETEIDIRMPVKSERTHRLHACGVGLVATTLLCIAILLKPSPEGIGTHQQLGLPVCGWILAADLPCPTCGMTTAWSHTVRGQLPSAFLAQPFGMLLALTAFAVAIGACITAITGISFRSLLYRYSPTKVIIVIATLVILSWVFKILLHKGVL